MEYALKKPKSQKRLRQAKQVKRNDYFSRLPDELIVSNILSHFTLEEGARYSILSRRWKNLWACTIGSKLIFAPEHLRTINVGDITELLNDRVGQLIFAPEHLRTIHVGDITELLNDRVGQLRPRYHPTESIDNRVKRLRACFECWISNVMQAYSKPKLDELTVRFPFDFSSRASIDMWLECAFKKGVNRLELNLGRWTLKSPVRNYCFPKLERFQGMLANCGGLYNNLRDVELKYIYVRNDVIEFMLTHFALERLCIEGLCVGKISIVSDSLKRLELIECDIDLKISASSLISLNYTGPENSLHLDHVPNLSELSVDEVFCTTFVPSCFLNSGYISGLKRLEFEMSDEAVRESSNYPLEFTETLKLEELKIGLNGASKDACFLWPIFLIQAAPFLHKFSVVKLRKRLSSALDRPNPLYHERVTNIRSAATRVQHHPCLKTIELQGYFGTRPKELELVKHLLCVSETLEQIIVSPTNICPFTIPVMRSRAEALTRWLPPSSKAKLIIL